MTGSARLHKMGRMKKIFVAGVALAMLAMAGTAVGQKDKDDEPTSFVYFLVIKDDNGKPVRNAAVIMHAVNTKGRQGRGGMELKTDPEGKANFDGIPYGKLRVQVLAILALAGAALGQKDKDDEPTSWMYFLVVKDDNGKPVRNAAVIMHEVNPKGKQGRGGMELKTDAEGKANFDGIPYGKLRVQVLAVGFQTFGEDYDVTKAKTDITIKLKRPQGQYSVYEDHPKDPNAPPKPDSPPDQNQKPN
jgi:hypothetical protein